ncbi:13357_t:CDS:2 [Ambispora gerdemannii]|uniref:13357_t:CDS:1 n=1 Tax=Ambispora gerdemannii TaxID=144530 RepID=A0A9N8WQE8_9GLOM|nr:13357_t:CDS:2 [Ambispora gerdemannii]
MAVPGLLSATSPTLVPSIVFVILFGISSILLGWRLSQNSSSPYRRLFLCFSLLRVAAFIARAFWSQDQNSQTKAIIAGVITASGYFLVVQSLYGVWVNQIADKKKSSFKLFIILCSIIGIIGIIGAVMQIINDANVGRILKKISTLGFLGLLIVLLFKSLTAQRDSNTKNNMAISNTLADVLIYVTLFAFMLVGIYAGKTQMKSKDDFLSALGTQLALPLAVNWFASNLGSSILFTYPEIGTSVGILGVTFYALTSVTPLLLFAWVGPIMRKKCPQGFTLTQFIRERFGQGNQIFMSLMSMTYMFCYMISELSSIGLVLMALTTVDKLAPIIILAATTTLYTAYGGFRASLLTDNVQGVCIMILMLIGTIGFSTNIKIDRSAIERSGLLRSNKLSWELLYILAVAIAFANFFHQGYWQRVFSSKNDRELRVSTIYGGIMLFIILFLVGFTGIIAVWANLCCSDDLPGASAFFYLIAILPDWVVGIVIVLSVALSCSAYDTLQSAMVSTMSNDLFANRLPLVYIRILTVVLNVPIVVLALRNVDVLRIFLIGDLIAAAAMPPVLLGLVDDLYFINGFDALQGSIGGLLSIFIFGTIYFGNAYDGINLIQLPNSFYAEDYSVLGAFLVAPIGGIVLTFVSFAARMGALYVWAKYTKTEFVFPSRPVEVDTSRYAGTEFIKPDDNENEEVRSDESRSEVRSDNIKKDARAEA